MATNLELKLKVNSFSKLKTILENNSAESKGILNQKDTYFAYKNGLLKLREQNGSFQLIKYSRNESGDDRWSNYELLTLSGERIEQYLCDILQQECVVEKKRELYIYDNTRVHFDEVKNLGLFMELETLVFGDMEDAKLRFDFIVKMLKLDFSKQIRKSYRNLILEK